MLRIGRIFSSVPKKNETKLRSEQGGVGYERERQVVEEAQYRGAWVVALQAILHSWF